MTHKRVNSQVGIFYDLWTSYNYEINESMACGVFLLSILLISLKQQQETLIFLVWFWQPLWTESVWAPPLPMLIILNWLEGKMEHTFNTNFLYLTAKHMY